MIQEEYDVVIVGSGIGGLCTGALLSKAGIKTLVLEKLSFIGGRFSTIKYKGYTLSTGGVCFEVGGAVEQLFKEVGAELNLRTGTGVSFYMNGAFHQMEGSGRLQRQVEAVSDDPKEVERVMGAIRNGMKWLEPSPSISFREWMLQYTQNEKVLGIFQSFMSGNVMLNADEASADQFFKIAKNSGFREIGVCPGGNIELMESLANVIRSNGGAVYTESPATQILIENGAVVGVKAKRNGQDIQIKTNVVVSNAGLKETVKITGAENFDKGYLKEFYETPSNKSCTEQVWIWFSSDKSLLPTSLVGVSDARRINAVIELTAFCKEYAPPGKHLYVSGASPGSLPGTCDYKKEMDICLDDLRKIIPDFDNQCEILLPQFYRGDWPGYRAWPGHGMPERTPIRNLYNVGDGVHISAGAVGTNVCAQSARLVVNNIIKMKTAHRA